MANKTDNVIIKLWNGINPSTRTLLYTSNFGEITSLNFSKEYSINEEPTFGIQENSGSITLDGITPDSPLPFILINPNFTGNLYVEIIYNEATLMWFHLGTSTFDPSVHTVNLNLEDFAICLKAYNFEFNYEDFNYEKMISLYDYLLFATNTITSLTGIEFVISDFCVNKLQSLSINADVRVFGGSLYSHLDGLLRALGLFCYTEVDKFVIKRFDEEDDSRIALFTDKVNVENIYTFGSEVYTGAKATYEESNSYKKKDEEPYEEVLTFKFDKPRLDYTFSSCYGSQFDGDSKEFRDAGSLLINDTPVNYHIRVRPLYKLLGYKIYEGNGYVDGTDIMNLDLNLYCLTSPTKLRFKNISSISNLIESINFIDLKGLTDISEVANEMNKHSDCQEILLQSFKEYVRNRAPETVKIKYVDFNEAGMSPSEGVIQSGIARYLENGGEELSHYGYTGTSILLDAVVMRRQFITDDNAFTSTSKGVREKYTDAGIIFVALEDSAFDRINVEGNFHCWGDYCFLKRSTIRLGSDKDGSYMQAESKLMFKCGERKYNPYNYLGMFTNVTGPVVPTDPYAPSEIPMPLNWTITPRTGAWVNTEDFTQKAENGMYIWAYLEGSFSMPTGLIDQEEMHLGATNSEAFRVYEASESGFGPLCPIKTDSIKSLNQITRQDILDGFTLSFEEINPSTLSLFDHSNPFTLFGITDRDDISTEVYLLWCDKDNVALYDCGYTLINGVKMPLASPRNVKFYSFRDYISHTLYGSYYTSNISESPTKEGGYSHIFNIKHNFRGCGYIGPSVSDVDQLGVKLCSIKPVLYLEDIFNYYKVNRELVEIISPHSDVYSENGNYIYSNGDFLPISCICKLPNRNLYYKVIGQEFSYDGSLQVTYKVVSTLYNQSQVYPSYVAPGYRPITQNDVGNIIGHGISPYVFLDTNKDITTRLPGNKTLIEPFLYSDDSRIVIVDNKGREHVVADYSSIDGKYKFREDFKNKIITKVYNDPPYQYVGPIDASLPSDFVYIYPTKDWVDSERAWSLIDANNDAGRQIEPIIKIDKSVPVYLPEAVLSNPPDEVALIGGILFVTFMDDVFTISVKGAEGYITIATAGHDGKLVFENIPETIEIYSNTIEFGDVDFENNFVYAKFLD